jgi:hypothetical protein
MPTRSDRSAALAITAGTLAGLVTMALHPSGNDVAQDAVHGTTNLLAPAVHWLAIVAQPFVLAGTLALTLRLRERRDLAVGAFVCFALASAAVMVAAAMSGLVFPAALRGVREADAAARVIITNNLRYTGLVNQAFAAVYVVLTALAVMTWSSAMLAGNEMPRALAGYGLVLGVLLLLGILSGHLSLGIHGFGAVVLGVGIWLIWAARVLWVGTTDRHRFNS